MFINMNKNKILIFSLSIIIAIFIIKIIPLTGYSEQHIAEQIIRENCKFNKTIESTANRDIMPGSEEQRGIGLRLYDTSGKIESKYVFSLKENESWEKFISIRHMIDEQWTYKLLLFIDYNKQSFYVDGKEVKDLTFKMAPNQTLEIPVEIDPLQKGRHDVLFALVKYPDVESTDEAFRGNTDMNHLLFLRYNIIVENGKIPAFELTEFKQYYQKLPFSGVTINKSSNDLNGWLSDIVKPESILKYYIHVGNKNTDKKQKRYALLMLFDWKQILIDSGRDKKHVLFFELDAEKELVIPATLKIPKEEGVYDLCPILITNPYERVNLYNNDVHTSIRVGLDVKIKE